MNKLLVLTCATSALLLGCGSPTPSTTTTTPSNRCVPGLVVACPCLTGGTGVQTCDPDGTFGRCMCLGLPPDVTFPMVDAAIDAPASDAPGTDVLSDARASDVLPPDVVAPDVPVDVAPPRPYPSGPYGTAVGDVFDPLSLISCGFPMGPWRFDQNGWDASPITAVSVCAAWSMQCQTDAMRLEIDIIGRYLGRPVRYVQLLTEDMDHHAATELTCRDWTARNALRNPEFTATAALATRYAAEGMYPTAYVVDASGHIRWRATGTGADNTHLRTAIDDALAHP